MLQGKTSTKFFLFNSQTFGIQKWFAKYWLPSQICLLF